MRVSNMTVYRLIRSGELLATRVGRSYRIWVPWATPMVEIVLTSRRRCRPASMEEATAVFMTAL